MTKLSPLVAGIAGTLAGRIHQGDFPSGRALPSERSLAQEFGASRLVIRASLAELERRGLLKRHNRCRPVVSARSLPETSVEQAQKAVSIWLWPHAADFGASLILKGIQRVQADPDLRLVIASAVGNDWDRIVASEAKFFNQIATDPHLVGGVVWYLGGNQNLPAIQAVREAGKQLVFVDRLPPTMDTFDYVGTDNKNAAEDAVKHLIELGHRSIACLSNRDPASSVNERVEGYRSALASAGIPFRPELLVPVLRDDDCGVAAGLDQLLALRERPTAIFGINDTIALQVHEELAQRAIKVPAEISVVGFDGLLRWVPGGGHLTTAKQNFERIGQLAMEILIENIEQGGRARCRHVLLEAPLALQGSSGPVPVTESAPNQGGKPTEVNS